jgi:organic radical activating enzyme
MSSVRTATRAPILEVFASIQGEGAYVGEPQAFVRLAGCPLRCRWCDTPGSWSPDRAERTPSEAADEVRAVEGVPPRTVSITGGEPLAYPEFVRALAAELAPRRVHLETAGAHPRALEHVLDAVHHVSLDLKLPADLDAPVPLPGAAGAPDSDADPRDAAEWRAVRRRALALVRGRDACGKLVLAGGRTPDDVAPLLDDLVEYAPALPLVVQPVTPMHGVAAPRASELHAVVDAVRARGLAVRVVPQVHRALRLP